MAAAVLATACGPVEAQTLPGPVEPYVESIDLCGKLPPELPELPARQSIVPAPPGLQVAWVLECVAGVPTPSGLPARGGRRADSAATELLAALGLPSATERSRICTDEYRSPFYLALITADGEAIAPLIPVDGCAKPRREVLAALGGLPSARQPMATSSTSKPSSFSR